MAGNVVVVTLRSVFIGYVVGNVLGILFVLLVLLVVAFTSYVKDAVYSKVVLFKNGSTRPLFHLFSSFQTHHKFYNKYVCEKMLIQYTALGFELTTLPFKHEPSPITTRPCSRPST